MKILTREFEPGNLLNVRKLAEELHVSRTPVREALCRMSGEGLVCIQPRGGTFINSLSAGQIRESLDVLSVLEGRAAALASCSSDSTALIRIQQMQQVIERAVAEGGDRRQDRSALGILTRADASFHLAIIDAARNDFLKQEIIRVHHILRVGGRLSVEGEWNDATTADWLDLKGHRAIESAIGSHDAVEACQAMQRHVAGRYARCVSSGDFDEPNYW